jgi:hypothetical protein
LKDDQRSLRANVHPLFVDVFVKLLCLSFENDIEAFDMFVKDSTTLMKHHHEVLILHGFDQVLNELLKLTSDEQPPFFMSLKPHTEVMKRTTALI